MGSRASIVTSCIRAAARNLLDPLRRYALEVLVVHETVRIPTPIRSRTASVLLIEDDELVARTMARLISLEGYRVVHASTSAAAVESFRTGWFDAVISDLHLPGSSGVDVLNVVRAYDPDIPVVLVTGDPDVESAIEAVNLGVLEYIVKPASREALSGVLKRATVARRAALLKRETMPTAPPPASFVAETSRPSDAAEVAASVASEHHLWERAMATSSCELEPVVDAKHRTVIGYEAKIRSKEETLLTQQALVVTAEKLGHLEELRRRARDLAVKAFVGAPSLATLFVDVHASDLLDSDLFDPDSPLSRIAERVVLQIRARGAALELEDLAARVSVLRFLGFRIAIADLDGGRARLAQIADLAPEFVKIDAELVRGVETSAPRRRIVGALASMCRALGAATIAEGVASSEERDALLETGCDLVQGPLLSRLAASRRTPFPGSLDR